MRVFLLMAACCIAPFAAAAEPVAGNAVQAALKGRWEGTLTGEFRAQDVSWHFEIDERGQLKGYMGPSTSGMPSLPMENLLVSNGLVSFNIASQHGTFEGAITPDGIAGVWQRGTALPLRMAKQNFAFPLPDSARAVLPGHWEANVGGTKVHLDFAEADVGMLTGTLAIPARRVPENPLVDIFVTEDGFAQFATDTGRRFSGRLVNGVLIGDYSAPGTNQRATFTKPDQAGRGFDLELTDGARARLLGRWYTEVRGDVVVLEFSVTEGNALRALLLFDEGPLRSDPLLEVIVEGENFRYTTLGGRTFNGSFIDEGIAGEYRSSFPFSVTFTREPQ